jgi:hypothetical protein
MSAAAAAPPPAPAGASLVRIILHGGGAGPQRRAVPASEVVKAIGALAKETHSYTSCCLQETAWFTWAYDIWGQKAFQPLPREPSVDYRKLFSASRSSTVLIRCDFCAWEFRLEIPDLVAVVAPAAAAPEPPPAAAAASSSPSPSAAVASSSAGSLGEKETSAAKLQLPVRCKEFVTAPSSKDEPHLQCCISLCPMVDPLQHKACGQCVCRVCAAAVAWKCPHCQVQERDASAYVVPAKPLLGLLDAVLVVCPGCRTELPRSRLRHHAREECTEKARFEMPAAVVVAEAEEPPKCTICRDMYAAPDQLGKCSKCFLKYHAEESWMRSHPLFVKHDAKIRDFDLEFIDQIFAAAHPNVRILTTAQATAFIRTYKAAPFVRMRDAFFGKQEFPRFVLRAVDADRLMTAMGKHYESDYHFAHLIAPRVIDRWAIRQHRDGHLGCYWLDMGGMTTPPTSREGLRTLWKHVSTDYIMA